MSYREMNLKISMTLINDNEQHVGRRADIRALCAKVRYADKTDLAVGVVNDRFSNAASAAICTLAGKRHSLYRIPMSAMLDFPLFDATRITVTLYASREPICWVFSTDFNNVAFSLQPAESRVWRRVVITR